MHFSTAFLIGAAAAVANAQVFFTMATIPATLNAGDVYNISWSNDAGTSTNTLLLSSGSGTQDQKPVYTIVSGEPHIGSYSWTVPSTIASGNYAFEIRDETNTNLINYSNRFDLDTPVASTASSAQSSTAAAESSTTSNSAGSTSAATTASGSSSSATGSSTTHTTSSSTGTASSSSTTPPPSTTKAPSDATALKVGSGVMVAVAGIMMAL